MPEFRLGGAGGEGDDRGWDGWMSSPTRWTWVCVSSRSWWWRGKPGVVQSMESQSVRHDWATELNWKRCYSLLTFLTTECDLIWKWVIVSKTKTEDESYSQKLEKGNKLSLCNCERKHDAAWICAYSLQKLEIIYFHCFKPPNCGLLFGQPPEN